MLIINTYTVDKNYYSSSYLLPRHVWALPGGSVVHGPVEGHRGHSCALLVVHLVTAAQNNTANQKLCFYLMDQ
jgi:hypothetical protein